MAANQKTKWLRSEPYLAWVRTLPSVVSGQPGCIAHHLTGYGSRGNTKVHDFWTIPLTGNEHNLGVGSLHSGPETWEAEHGNQWGHVAVTLKTALDFGLFDFSDTDYQLLPDMGSEDSADFCQKFVMLIESGNLVLNKKKSLGTENIL